MMIKMDGPSWPKRVGLDLHTRFKGARGLDIKSGSTHTTMFVRSMACSTVQECTRICTLLS